MNRLLPWTALVFSLAALGLSLWDSQTPPPPPAAVAEATGPSQAQLDAYARRVEALEVTTLSLARCAACAARRTPRPRRCWMRPSARPTSRCAARRGQARAAAGVRRSAAPSRAASPASLERRQLPGLGVHALRGLRVAPHAEARA